MKWLMNKWLALLNFINDLCPNYEEELYYSNPSLYDVNYSNGRWE
jgi:hypothetical protein